MYFIAYGWSDGTFLSVDSLSDVKYCVICLLIDKTVLRNRLGDIQQIPWKDQNQPWLYSMKKYCV